MRILVLLTGRPLSDVARRITEMRSPEHEMTVVDLSTAEPAYERIIDAICAHDKVISW